jgi:hypothetical protein
MYWCLKYEWMGWMVLYGDIVMYVNSSHTKYAILRQDQRDKCNSQGRLQKYLLL